MRPLKAIIDLNALQHNLQQVKILAPTSKILAMVKANAYGHGLVEVAQALTAADALGVACVDEALQLRHSGVKQNIVVMQGFYDAIELTEIVQYNLIPVVHSSFQLELLKGASKNINIWLKINTGMNRLGFEPEHILTIQDQLKQLPKIKIATVLSHFSHANLNEEDAVTKVKKQIKKYEDFCNSFNGDYEKSMANSAAILRYPESHYSWVRPGLMLYGASPIIGTLAEDYNLKPVMNLKTKIIAIYNCKKGDKIGYDGLYACPKNMKIAVAAIGYGDGITTTFNQVVINGKKTKILGKISMDMLTVSLDNINAKVGDNVSLWGCDCPIEHVASNISLSPYSLFTSLVDRVPRLALA